MFSKSCSKNHMFQKDALKPHVPKRCSKKPHDKKDCYKSTCFNKDTQEPHVPNRCSKRADSNSKLLNFKKCRLANNELCADAASLQPGRWFGHWHTQRTNSSSPAKRHLRLRLSLIWPLLCLTWTTPGHQSFLQIRCLLRFLLQLHLDTRDFSRSDISWDSFSNFTFSTWTYCSWDFPVR